MGGNCPLCDIPLGQATRFVTQLDGPDHLPFTADDIRYARLDQALGDLRISIPSAPSPPANRYPKPAPAAATPPLTAFLTLTSSFRRIVSTGTAGRYQRTLHAIAKLDAAARNTILEWQE